MIPPFLLYQKRNNILISTAYTYSSAALYLNYAPQILT
jgi:hypothetical protein